MSDVVIRAEGLGKKYIIGHQAERERYTTLRDSIGRSLRNWGRSARDMFAGRALVSGDEIEEFWALKDINFEIKRGDVVGIIGRNGAGKSTLLKVLSRITEPTEGCVTIGGRVASLLEVGTGFHPELSGRENIYLNGAILGMSRGEIRNKFDEIVDFAGVEKFLDTPVKRYSSGMYVRLAFAVAAHLEPEILVVDEVLAVGDAEFQKKCLGKMKDVAGHGRTVLFVSHNMAAVRSLCASGILLNNGRIDIWNTAEIVVDRYLRPNATNTHKLHDGVHLKNLSVVNDLSSATIVCDLILEASLATTISDLTVVIETESGTRIAISDLRDRLNLPSVLHPGQFRVSGEIGKGRLVENKYCINLYFGTDAGSQDFRDIGSLKFVGRPPEGRRYPTSSLGFMDLGQPTVLMTQVPK